MNFFIFGSMLRREPFAFLPPTLRFPSSFFLRPTSQLPKYNVHDVESKFRSIAMPRTNTSDPYYILTMFPYPSGQLHMGHVRVYTLSDVLARYHRMQGKKVLFPMGWDAFGLPAENAAKERNIDPHVWTTTNISQMKTQLQSLAIDFDWDKEFATCDVDYYKHTQTFFKFLWKSGFAYQKEAYVYWDPIDQTVLANEQVDALGRSWRSGALVEKRKLKQWFLKITHFAEELLQGLNHLDWPDEVKQMQKQWIGKSDGYEVKFPLLFPHSQKSVTVFTTDPETLLLATSLVVSPTHECLNFVPPSLKEKVLKAIQALKQEHLDPTYCSNLSVDKEKIQGHGIETGLYVLHPITHEHLPIYVVNHLDSEYGTGTKTNFLNMNDSKDPFLDFALHHEPSFSPPSPMTHLSSIIKEGPFQGKSLQEAWHLFLNHPENCRRKTSYKLRDWLISRQRAWGCPIPILHCPLCGPVPSSETVPLGLPKGTKAPCPQCHTLSVYDSDTMDTFVDSSWYYLRFLNPGCKDPFDTTLASSFLPVHLYIGGIEHAILHLLYARFFSLWIHHHWHPLPFHGEPFRRLVTQGMVHGKTYRHALTKVYLPPDQVDTSVDPPRTLSTMHPVEVKYEKMSKSKHNGVAPQDILCRHGTDATRAYILAMAPIAHVLEWDDRAIVGFSRWLTKVHGLVHQRLQHLPSIQLESVLDPVFHKTSCFKDQQEEILWNQCNKYKRLITKSLETVQAVNTIPATLMKFTNTLTTFSPPSQTSLIFDTCLVDLLRLMAPITPCLTQSLWTTLFPTTSLSKLWTWPKSLSSSTTSSSSSTEITVMVQLNGKNKETLKLSKEKHKNLMEQVHATSLWQKHHACIQEIRVFDKKQPIVVNCITNSLS